MPKAQGIEIMGVLHDTSRKAKQSDFVGKTIKSIDASADNVIRFEFTDETFCELWAENGPFGFPVIEVDPLASPSGLPKKIAG